MKDGIVNKLLTLLLFVGLALCSHASFLPLAFGFAGTGFVYVGGDVQTQLIPAVSFLERSLAAGGLGWSFEYGLGGDLFSQFSYYYTTSPFFYLQYLVKSALGVAGGGFAATAMWRLFFSVVKQVLCMWLMFVLLRREGHRWVSSACAAALYGCSFWYIDNAFAFDFMTDAMIWPPLVMLELGRWQRGGAWWPLALVFALMLANSVYFGFINAVFCIVVALVFCWVGACDELGLGARLARYAGRIVKFALVFALGLAIADAAFYPAVSALLDADRAQVGATFAWLPSASFLALLPEIFFAKAGMYTADAAQNFGLPLMVLLAPLVRFKDVDELGRKKSVLALVMLIMALLPIASSAMNGLSYPSNRWCYLVFFAIAYALPVWMEALVTQGRIHWAAVGVLAMLAVVFLLTHDTRVAAFSKEAGHGFWTLCNSDWTLFAIELGAIAALKLSKPESIPADQGGHVVSMSSAKISPAVTVLFLAAIVVAMPYGPYTFHSHFRDTANAEEFTSAGQLAALFPGSEDFTVPYHSMTQGETGFYRFIDEQAAQSPVIDGHEARFENRTWIMGGYGATLYNSLIPKNLSQTLKQYYGITTLTNTVSQYRGFGHRLLLENAWGVQKKFNVGESSNTFAYEHHGHIWENRDWSGIDLWYSSYTPESIASEWSYAEKDAAIMQVATVEDGAVGDSGVLAALPSFDTVLEFELDEDVVSYENCEYADGVLVAWQGAAIEIAPVNEYYVAGESVGEFLLTFTAVERSGESFVFTANGENYWTGKADYQWGYPRNEYTVCFVDNPDVIRIEVDPGEYEVSGVKLEYNSYRRVEQWTDEINRIHLLDVVVDGGRIEGALNADEPGILALSVPFDEGWSCTVNGEPHKILRVNGAMMGIEVAAGTYDVAFSYENPHLATGIRITEIALAALVVAAVATGLIKRRRNRA